MAPMLGPLMQRVSAAVKSIFHLWALARPAGMMQGRGAMVAFWDDALPAMPDELRDEHRVIVAQGPQGDPTGAGTGRGQTSGRPRW